jgi:hypothetical protein
MVVSKAEIGIEHCKTLDPQLDFYKASQQLDEIREDLRKSPEARKKLWQDKVSCLQMGMKVYKLFNVFVDMASLEYKRGCHRHAVSSLRLALEIREMVPAEAVSQLVAYCKNDPRACQLDLSKTNKAMEARSLKKELKFFEQAPTKLRVLAAKMLMQLGGQTDAERAGRLFGEAIQIGLQSFRSC